MLVWIVLVAFAAAFVLVFGALVEMLRTLEQLRIESGILDSLTPIDVPAGPAALTAAGLTPLLADRPRAIVLVLSDMCVTCRKLAERIAGGLPDDVWLLFEPKTVQTGEKWLSQYGLGSDPRLLIDPDGRLAAALQMQISPAVVRIRDGGVVAAHTLPSPRRLEEELRWLRGGGEDRPMYGHIPDTIRFSTTKAEASS
ncbi:hypothetical protein E1091_05615 [Micromonospora fluostatini]|uniref:Thioredoxin domain-containing protein n=1 Tax=Micromonospora fluostatini TaxID=1629071 RepID=A0ABY2DJA3_9ACTN|nr:hypothetical protein E1091_05615 [Micromonospora fluostatini]